MSYATELAKLTRKKITKVEIDLDYCSRTWNVSPCTPAGGSSNCYNTYRTCNDDGPSSLPKAHFDKTTKTYVFTSMEFPVPTNGYRPYLKSCDYLPQEIKDSITVKNRVTVELIDDYNESDIDNDPYRSTRSHSSINVNGSYFKRLFARNPNYKYRAVRIYEGFTLWGAMEGDWQLRFTGLIDSIAYEKGTVKINVSDNFASLENYKITIATVSKLAQDIDYNDTGDFAADNIEFVDPAPGYVMIDDEIMYCSDQITNGITVTTRGNLGTTAAPHSSGASVTQVKYYNGSPVLILANLANDAGFDMDSVSFAEVLAKRTYTEDPDLACLIVSDTKASELFWEIIEQFGFKAWVDNAGVLYIRRNIFYSDWDALPSYLSAPPVITDALNIIDKSTSVDLNDKSRFSRIKYYWGLRYYTGITKLAVNINSSETSIQINSIAEPLPPAGEVLIDSEFIEYTGVASGPNRLTGCVRARKSSTAASHTAGALINISDLSHLKELKNSKSFANLTVTIDTDAESEIGKTEPKIMYSRFFNVFTKYFPYTSYISAYSTYIDSLSTKLLASMRDARTKFSFGLEIKDESILIGDFVKITTDDFNEADTTNYNEKLFQVIKKEPSQSNVIKYVSEKVISYD